MRENRKQFPAFGTKKENSDKQKKYGKNFFPVNLLCNRFYFIERYHFISFLLLQSYFNIRDRYPGVVFKEKPRGYGA
jgi:hypothetical protein